MKYFPQRSIVRDPVTRKPTGPRNMLQIMTVLHRLGPSATILGLISLLVFQVPAAWAGRAGCDDGRCCGASCCPSHLCPSGRFAWLCCRLHLPGRGPTGPRTRRAAPKPRLRRDRGGGASENEFARSLMRSFRCSTSAFRDRCASSNASGAHTTSQRAYARESNGVNARG